NREHALAWRAIEALHSINGDAEATGHLKQFALHTVAASQVDFLGLPADRWIADELIGSVEAIVREHYPFLVAEATRRDAQDTNWIEDLLRVRKIPELMQA